MIFIFVVHTKSAYLYKQNNYVDSCIVKCVRKALCFLCLSYIKRIVKTIIVVYEDLDFILVKSFVKKLSFTS